jgi:hypothetical protein
LVHRLQPKLIIAGGTVFGGLGLYSLSQLTPDSSYVGHVLPSIILIAMGMGSIFVPITLAAVSAVDPTDTGIASAMLNVGQQVGGTIGLASLTTVATHAANSYGSAHRAAAGSPGFFAQVFTHGADAAFVTGALFMVVGLAAALFLIAVRSDEAEVVAPVAG